MSSVPNNTPGQAPITQEKLLEVIAKSKLSTTSNGCYGQICTMRVANESPKQALNSAQQRYAEHASGIAPLSPGESIRLRGTIDMLSQVVNPETQNSWPEYSAAEKGYLANRAAEQRVAANNLGMMFGGPVFSALPALGRLFGAPENVVENLGQINADLAGVVMGPGRVSPKQLGRPGTGQAGGATLEPVKSGGVAIDLKRTPQKSEFISDHSYEKHKYDSTKQSTKNRTQYGKHVDPADIKDKTLNFPDNVEKKFDANGNHYATVYKKEFLQNISTTNTPTNSSRVIVNHADPTRSTQFPRYVPSK